MQIILNLTGLEIHDLKIYLIEQIKLARKRHKKNRLQMILTELEKNYSVSYNKEVHDYFNPPT